MTTLDVAPDEARPEPPPASAPPLDRTISPIAGRFGAGMTAKAVTVAALAVGCGIFVFAGGRHAPPKAKTPDQPAAQVVPFEAANPVPTLANPGLAAPSLAGSTPTVPALQSGPAAPGASTPSAVQTAAQVQAAKVQAIRGAPILAFDRNGAASSVAALAAAPGEAEKAAATELDQLRQGSTIGLARAGRLPDRHYLIVAGTQLPCTLLTAMDTGTPGYVSCIIGQDVYSDDGGVVLMEKGTRVLGEYRSGMHQGQSRLFVLWTRAVTPAGVAIGLASPASDALGRAGFDGAIDSHFWDRFGGALLLSIVDDGASAVASKAYGAQETLHVPSDAAAVAMQNSVNIPPSLRKAQGSQVAIFVAQDLNFSTVYGLKAR